ncbi:hypothetical protein ASPU41_11725 [Arthrobacter sp. U41]|nr:hypothetical protein ASPU41_11725 [Arthrobacter sp. U41]
MQQAGVDQDLEVVGHGGLPQVQRFGEVADAGLPAVGALDDGDQPQPVGIGQRLEDQGFPLRFLGAQDRHSCRGAAGFIRGRLECGQRVHVPIMPRY